MSRVDEMTARTTEAPRGVVTFLPEPDPEPLWCPIISVDDHLVEPPTMFEGRVPAAMADLAPRVVTTDKGVPAWLIEGQHHVFATGNGAAGRPMKEWQYGAAMFEDFRPGVMDPHQRLRDMDLSGVWASANFSSLVWGFAGSRFIKFQDPAVGYAMLRAYNDWLAEEWVAAAPDRFIGSQLPWLGDAEVAAEEIRRNAGQGLHAVSFTENPVPLGLPSLHTDYWDPFFRACVETGTVLNLHVGGSGTITQPSPDGPKEVPTSLFPVNSMIAVVDWIFSRIPLRFPDLRIVLSEGGVSWVPTIIERLNRAWDRVDASDCWSRSDPHPADVLRNSFWFASIDDPSAFHQLDIIGADRVMLETDYPHPDSSWPNAQSHVRRQLEHLPADVTAQICYKTAAALYRHPEPAADWVAERTALGKVN